MTAQGYKRLEQIIVTIMLLGIIAMFQPWFENIVELFEPLAPDARLGRTYRNEYAPIILRIGFWATFLGTVAFISISHYSYDELLTSSREKGTLLTILLVLIPIVYGFVVIANLAWAYHWAAIVGVFNVVFAIAVWNKKLWGLIGLGITALIELGLAFSGSAWLPIAIVFVALAVGLFALIWPKRAVALN